MNPWLFACITSLFLIIILQLVNKMYSENSQARLKCQIVYIAITIIIIFVYSIQGITLFSEIGTRIAQVIDNTLNSVNYALNCIGNIFHFLIMIIVYPIVFLLRLAFSPFPMILFTGIIVYICLKNGSGSS